MAREREKNENTVKALKSKVKVSEQVAESIEREWTLKMEEIIIQANTERIKWSRNMNPQQLLWYLTVLQERATKLLEGTWV